MSEEIQRFDPVTYHDMGGSSYGEVEKRSDGEYVRYDDHVQIIEKLKSPWQDIALAPKDGTRVLVWCPDTRWKGVMCFFTNEGWWEPHINRETTGNCAGQPTQFQPLTEPPEGR